MTPLAWLLGLFLPACGAVGAQGLPVPQPLDLARIERPATPNTALAAPAGFQPPPDLVTPVYQVPAQQLYDAIRAVAAGQPRSFIAAEYPDRRQSHYVVRSAMFNFPDLVTIEAMPAGPAASRLFVYSRSVFGRSDLGVNRARVVAWLAALDRSLTATQER
ncbi:MAG: DUF1499 domain-containing protein [Acetobacteraceae bacterium]|nr:DUF1499 domain-containing protein [Acetobacteraceae bacterium]